MLSYTFTVLLLFQSQYNYPFRTLCANMHVHLRVEGCCNPTADLSLECKTTLSYQKLQFYTILYHIAFLPFSLEKSM